MDEVHNHLRFGELRPLRGYFHGELFARPSVGLRDFHCDSRRGDSDAVEVVLKELHDLSRALEKEVRPLCDERMVDDLRLFLRGRCGVDVQRQSPAVRTQLQKNVEVFVLVLEKNRKLFAH